MPAALASALPEPALDVLASARNIAAYAARKDFSPATRRQLAVVLSGEVARAMEGEGRRGAPAAAAVAAAAPAPAAAAAAAAAPAASAAAALRRKRQSLPTGGIPGHATRIFSCASDESGREGGGRLPRHLPPLPSLRAPGQSSR